MLSSYIQVYIGIRTRSHIYVKGRLLASSAAISNRSDSYIRSMWVSIRRANTCEVKYSNITLGIGAQTIDLQTDGEGYFEYFSNAVSVEETIRDVVLQALVNGRKQSCRVELKAYLHDISLGIISDIDDTVLITGVRSFFKLRMIVNSIFINPFRRKPIEAAAKYYTSLLAQQEGSGPIIYVSNSPWNMFDYLKTFLSFNNFPSGELVLRDFGLQMLRRKKPLKLQNKYLAIKRILDIFDGTKFILIGDSAEVDYEIYKIILDEHPSQVAQVIIVKAGNARNEERIKRDLKKTADQSILLTNSFEERYSPRF